MKKIKLTKNKFSLVDDSDFDMLNKLKWHSYYDGYNWYALHTKRLPGNKFKSFQMHRLLLNPSSSKVIIDHKDGDGLNNQRSNLRLCTHSENMKNRRSMKISISGLKGVSWNKKSNKWEARIMSNRKNFYLGGFDSKIKAYDAYCKGCFKYHGKFARIK